MTLLPIPPVDSATDPIGSAADLQQRWRALMQELGFGERLLRFVFVGPDRRLLKVLTDIEIGVRPSRGVIDDLMSRLRTVVDGLGEGHSLALLLSRPGRDGVSTNDRRWCAALTAAAGSFGVPLEPMFRANDEALVPLEPAQVR
jgi:hypothetical protein